MYIISDKINKGKILDKMEILDIDGLFMASKNRVFKIHNCNIRKICIMNKKLANPIASKMVSEKYEKLIFYLTDLLTDDDDSGESYHEALNQIEKFRLEIKNKYREYLTRKELEKMSKQLSILQKEAIKRYEELRYSYSEYLNENNRRR